ncbi:MAG: carboxymuconolactone decarboxylase family protein [Dehalococcoidia bacterium]
MDINAAGGSKLGISDEKIADLAQYANSDHYSERERIALELADAMSAAAVDISDGLYSRLRTHFDETQLVELSATAAMENFRARFNRVFQIEPNALYCPIEGHQ